jgi:ribosomal protein S18 acetylase RimI-like enzyme
MAVDPRFRGQGIGEQLVLALHEEFRKRQIDHYELSVDNDNLPTLSLYQKLGARVEREYWEDRVHRSRLKNILR